MCQSIGQKRKDVIFQIFYVVLKGFLKVTGSENSLYLQNLNSINCDEEREKWNPFKYYGKATPLYGLLCSTTIGGGKKKESQLEEVNSKQ